MLTAQNQSHLEAYVTKIHQKLLKCMQASDRKKIFKDSKKLQI